MFLILLMQGANMKIVFYLFVFVLCNTAFGTSVVSNDRNRRTIFCVNVKSH